MKKEIPRDEFLKKRAERQRKIRKRRLKAFFVFFIILLLTVGVILSLTVFFPIEKLSAGGSKIYSQEQILKLSGIKKGDNLFAISNSKTTEKLKKSLPYVETITFKRQMPDTLKIIVKDAEEFACYKVKNKYYIVSRSGWVLEESKEPREEIVLITAKDVKCKVGSEISFSEASHRDIVDNLSSALEEEKLKVDSVDVTNTFSIAAKVEGRFDVNFGNSNDLQSKVRHLGAMIKEIPTEKSGKIDLSMWTNENTKGTFVAN